MKRIVRYYPVTGTPRVTHLKAEVRYEQGGYNVFTAKSEPRGFYFAMTPVEKGRGLESVVAFSGKKWCIREVKRFSPRVEAECHDLFRAIIDSMISEHFPNYNVCFDEMEEKEI